jgi:hypothetical protein
VDENGGRGRVRSRKVHLQFERGNMHRWALSKLKARVIQLSVSQANYRKSCEGGFKKL